MKTRKYISASSLPENWDALCTSYFQKRKFLAYAEIYNPCQQRYYLLTDKQSPIIGACVYSIKIDLFTYSGLKSPVRMTIIGIPASVSCCGIVGDLRQLDRLLDAIYEEESGIVVALNTPPGVNARKGITMRTLPGVELHHNYANWNEYLFNLRSEYRRRIKLASRRFTSVERLVGSCSEFTDRHYHLYQQVWERSKTRLEFLRQDFFTHLPAEFMLVSYYAADVLLAWHIILKDRPRLVFFYGGTDYHENKKYRAYYNNLTGILMEAFEEGFEYVELGQTAEIAKIRFGAAVIEKNMIAYHRNPFIRTAIRLGTPFLEYRRKIPVANVFKKISTI